MHQSKRKKNLKLEKALQSKVFFERNGAGTDDTFNLTKQIFYKHGNNIRLLFFAYLCFAKVMQIVNVIFIFLRESVKRVMVLI